MGIVASISPKQRDPESANPETKNKVWRPFGPVGVRISEQGCAVDGREASACGLRELAGRGDGAGEGTEEVNEGEIVATDLKLEVWRGRLGQRARPGTQGQRARSGTLGQIGGGSSRLRSENEFGDLEHVRLEKDVGNSRQVSLENDEVGKVNELLSLTVIS